MADPKFPKLLVGAGMLAAVGVGSVGDNFVGIDSPNQDTALIEVVEQVEAVEVVVPEIVEAVKAPKIMRACTTAKCGLDDYLCDLWNGAYDNAKGDRTRARMMGRCDKKTTNEQIGVALVSTVSALDYHETKPEPEPVVCPTITPAQQRSLTDDLASKFKLLEAQHQ